MLVGEDDVPIDQIARSLGETTNNVAEYTALVTGLEAALARGVTDIEIFLDSELVVHQVKGEWKIKNDRLRPLAVKAQSLLRRFGTMTIEHIPRSLNEAADALANLAMDAAAEDDDLSLRLEQRSLFET